MVRVLRPHPEPGRDFELHETIAWCLHNDMRVSVWGAYRIEPILYYKALRQIALLNSGQVRYKANDAGYRNNRVSNCIHAVSELSEGYRLRVASPGYGEMASYFILRVFAQGARLLSPIVMKITPRLMGLLLAAIAFQFFLNALRELKVLG